MKPALAAPRARPGRGFSLLEMLVALAIVSIGLVAALRATGVGTEGAREYRNHMLALWLAENTVAERTARQDWPETGTTSDEETFANQRFLVRQEIMATPNPQFRRLNVTVSTQEEPERALQRSVAFLILLR